MSYFCTPQQQKNSKIPNKVEVGAYRKVQRSFPPHTRVLVKKYAQSLTS